MTRAGRSARRRQAVLGALLAGTLLAACSGAGGGHTGARGQRSSPRVTASGPSTTQPAERGASSPLGAHWDISRVGAFDAYLESLRGTATFTEVVWCKVEKSRGHRDWGKIDAVADAAQRHGIELYLKIRVGACWATHAPATKVRGSGEKTESAVPADMGAYEDFVRAVATRYAPRGVTTFAIENEVNSASFWSGTPQQYVALVRTAASALRSADPSAQIADAGMSSTTYGYGIADQLLRAGKDSDAVAAWNTYFQRRIGTRGDQVPRVTSAAQLRQVLASAQGVRNLAYLSIAHQLAEGKVTDVRQIHFYEPWQAVPLLVRFLADTTPSGTPIEAWEVGSFWKDPQATDASRASEMVRTITLLLAGGVKRVIWLPLATSADNRRGQEIRYGLLDPGGAVRPAGAAFRELVGVSRGASVTPVTSPRLQGVSFDSGDDHTLVVWGDQGGQTPVRLDLGPGALTAAVGAQLAPPSGPTTVTVGPEPQLLQTARPLADVLPR